MELTIVNVTNISNQEEVENAIQIKGVKIENLVTVVKNENNGYSLIFK